MSKLLLTVELQNNDRLCVHFFGDIKELVKCFNELNRAIENEVKKPETSPGFEAQKSE